MEFWSCDELQQDLHARRRLMNLGRSVGNISSPPIDHRWEENLWEHEIDNLQRGIWGNSAQTKIRGRGNLTRIHRGRAREEFEGSLASPRGCDCLSSARDSMQWTGQF